jgi:hypothetical protein
MLELTSLSSVQEGLFLYTRNVSPYDGGVFHQVWSPDLLSLVFTKSRYHGLGAASSPYIRPTTEC